MAIDITIKVPFSCVASDWQDQGPINMKTHSDCPWSAGAGVFHPCYPRRGSLKNLMIMICAIAIGACWRRIQDFFPDRRNGVHTRQLSPRRSPLKLQFQTLKSTMATRTFSGSAPCCFSAGKHFLTFFFLAGHNFFSDHNRPNFLRLNLIKSYNSVQYPVCRGRYITARPSGGATTKIQQNSFFLLLRSIGIYVYSRILA